MTGGAPGYWKNETSGILQPVAQAYLQGHFLVPPQIATMRAYLRQWIEAPGFLGEDVIGLRLRVQKITTNDDLRSWIEDAIDAGVDPL